MEAVLAILMVGMAVLLALAIGYTYGYATGADHQRIQDRLEYFVKPTNPTD